MSPPQLRAAGHPIKTAALKSEPVVKTQLRFFFARQCPAKSERDVTSGCLLAVAASEKLYELSNIFGPQLYEQYFPMMLNII